MEEIVKHQEKLVTIPYIDCSTVGMVAQYCGVSKSTIRNRCNTYRDQLDKCGGLIVTPKELEDLLPKKAIYSKSVNKSKVTYSFENGQNVDICITKNWIFTKEAVDFLRTVILNPKENQSRQDQTVEKEPNVSSVKDKTKFRSEDEKKLCINLARAFASGDTLKLISAALDLDNYRITVISELSKRIDEAVPNIENKVSWMSRSSIHKIIKTISAVVNVNKNDILNSLYYKIMYDYKIPLDNRQIMPLINAVKDSEWHLLYKAVVTLCEEHLLNVQQVFDRAGVDMSGLSAVIEIEGGEV